MDNTLHHSVKLERFSINSWRKRKIISLLHDHSFNENRVKAKHLLLANCMENNTDAFQKIYYFIYIDIADKNGHSVCLIVLIS